MYAVTTAVRLPIDDPKIFHALHWRYIRQLNIETASSPPSSKPGDPEARTVCAFRTLSSLTPEPVQVHSAFPGSNLDGRRIGRITINICFGTTLPSTSPAHLVRWLWLRRSTSPAR